MDAKNQNHVSKGGDFTSHLNSLSNTNKRDETLDLAKGILITLVALGHSIQYSFGSNWITTGQFLDDIVFKTIYSFHMPLFMMISGYLFYNSNKKPFKALLVSKLKAIGIPMFSFILIFNIKQYISLLIHGNILDIFKHLIETIFLGSTMWFLFSLLLNIAALATLTRVVKHKHLQYIAMSMLFVASMFIPDNVILSVHKFMFPFFCIGYTIKQNGINIYACSGRNIRLCALSILSVFAIGWFNRSSYIYTSGFCIIGDYGYQLFIDCKRMAIALVVSYTFMQYIHKFDACSNFITKKAVMLGQMSLFIYGFNIVFNPYYIKALALSDINFRFNYLVPILTTLVFICVSYYLYKLLDNKKVTRALFLGK